MRKKQSPDKYYRACRKIRHVFSLYKGTYRLSRWEISKENRRLSRWAIFYFPARFSQRDFVFIPEGIRCFFLILPSDSDKTKTETMISQKPKYLKF